ncbi:hypothetical protein L3Y34_017008 [Caenorhabditis briggsae]|uniref:Uncharacterized protein n=1 Tax=Caenorhabditis briggsae TaxID=6238 RepID=A0AAE9ISE8_CAEBR|nr:hypothetical protein L3Y34_017008 [Caenorhabditis briggsae]
MQSYEISFLITKFGFFLAVFANSFLIYITLCHVRKIDAIYKTMVSFYAMLGILFSGWELIAKPFMHNFNESMVFFSLRTTVSQKFFQFSIAFYAGMSEALMALMAAQFVYRYLVSCRAEHSKKYEQGSGLLWILYPAIPGILYYSSFYLFCLPDHYADSYLSVYPAIDSIVFMMVVSEYSRIIKSRIIGIFSTSSPIPTHSSTINVRCHKQIEMSRGPFFTCFPGAPTPAQPIYKAPAKSLNIRCLRNILEWFRPAISNGTPIGILDLLSILLIILSIIFFFGLPFVDSRGSQCLQNCFVAKRVARKRKRKRRIASPSPTGRNLDSSYQFGSSTA